MTSRDLGIRLQCRTSMRAADVSCRMFVSVPRALTEGGCPRRRLGFMWSAVRLVCLLVLLIPFDVEAQSLDGCTLDFRVGIAVPVADLADEVGSGPTFGAGLSCLARSPLMMRGGLEFVRFDGPVDLIQASLLTGGELWFPLESRPLHVRVRLEGGWAFTDLSGSYPLGLPPRAGLVQSGPVLAPGAGVTAGLGRRLQVTVDVGFRVLFSNSDERVLAPGDVQPGFDRVVFVPLVAGLRLPL